MESHEERIQEIIERNKEIEATEERKRRAKEIARKEHERKHGFMSSNGDYDGANRFMGSKDRSFFFTYRKGMALKIYIYENACNKLSAETLMSKVPYTDYIGSAYTHSRHGEG